MTRCIIRHATNRPPSSALALHTTICAPICTASVCRTFHTACTKRPQSTSCSLVPCTKKPGISSGTRKPHCKRSYGVPRGSLKEKFTSSSPQTHEGLRSFLRGTLKRKRFLWSYAGAQRTDGLSWAPLGRTENSVSFAHLRDRAHMVGVDGACYPDTLAGVCCVSRCNDRAANFRGQV